MAWQRITAVENCPPGKSLEVVAGDRVIALFNVAGEFFALDGVCPHQGGPLAEGELTGCIVTCPWHGWQFDVRTGQHQLSRNLQQPSLETKVETGAVWVNVSE
ncbi:MAG TPA: Rieske 2Fe-2S domain-containing protein [Pirellulales bacterium]|nr:Rieske 2Fe-2S domain-containing protein [Pirellulales bacterium]